MATLNVGRVQPIGRGIWSSATAYEAMDIVYYNGASYWALQPGTNKQPDTETSYWQLMTDPTIGSQLASLVSNHQFVLDEVTYNYHFSVDANGELSFVYEEAT